MTTIEIEIKEEQEKSGMVSQNDVGRPAYVNWFHMLTVFLIPIVLGLGGVLLVIQLDFPAWEYGRIEADAYGWSEGERLELADKTLGFIRSGSPVELAVEQLAAVTLPHNDDVSLYNARELEHMADVKRITDLFRLVFPLILITALVGVIVVEANDRKLLGDVMLQGGWLTLILVGGVGIMMRSAWNFFFMQFHELLFPAGSYTFEWTDSLIRLFPPKFWIDFGAITVVIILLPAIVMTAVGEWSHRGKQGQLGIGASQ
jgi:integral membrane protein (TIGR01906 family)